MIDLDPQTNATIMLIGEPKWEEVNSYGLTLACLFQDALDEKHEFDLDSTLQGKVSKVRDVRSVPGMASTERIREPSTVPSLPIGCEACLLGPSSREDLPGGPKGAVP